MNTTEQVISSWMTVVRNIDFNSILAVDKMYLALKAHYTLNLNRISDLIDNDQIDGRTSRPSLLESEQDMRALVADEGRIRRKAEELVAANYARAKANRKSSTKAQRKSAQLARSMAAEAAKTNRVKGGKKNK